MVFFLICLISHYFAPFFPPSLPSSLNLTGQGGRHLPLRQGTPPPPSLPPSIHPSFPPSLHSILPLIVLSIHPLPPSLPSSQSHQRGPTSAARFLSRLQATTAAAVAAGTYRPLPSLPPSLPSSFPLSSLCVCIAQSLLLLLLLLLLLVHALSSWSPFS